MTRISIASTLAVGLLALGLPLATGCTSSPAPEDTGSVVVPLLQPGPNGKLFHLTNAVFDLTGNGTTQTIDGSGLQSSIAVDVSPGLYNLFLRDGWVLEESDDGGATFFPIDVLFGSANPTTFRVLANQPSIIQFDFLLRNANGTVVVKLGVQTAPRELAGGVVVTTGTDEFAQYQVFGTNTLDFGVFFSNPTITTKTLADGTKQRLYAAAPGQVLGPTQPTGSAVAAEFYNDKLGIFARTVGPDFAGGFLNYTVAANPDGTFEFDGQLFGATFEIDFGPSTIDAVLPDVDAAGFPVDGFFYDAGAPFTLSEFDPNTGLQVPKVTGTLRVRHLLPPQ